MSDYSDSDAELQEAFAAGILRPGINVEVAPVHEKVNNEPALKQTLAMFKNNLPFVERLEVTTGLAPMNATLELENKTTATTHNTLGEDVHNDFLREMNFYRQAQEAVRVGLAKLKKLKVPTLRPQDYFAEMVKSDQHMEKIREKVISKKLSIERQEKAKKLREQRKYGKKVQQEVLQTRQKQKKEMLDAVKRFRKGQETSLDFLDKGGNKSKGQNSNDRKAHVSKKRKLRDDKYGFGGQKKRSKQNTRDSAADTREYSVKKFSRAPGKGAQGGKKQRLGKSKRKQARGKKR